MCPQNKGKGKVANSYQPAAGWDPKRWWTINKRGWGKGGTHTFGQAPRMGGLMGRWGKAIVHSLNLSPKKLAWGIHSHPRPAGSEQKSQFPSIPLWCDCDYVWSCGRFRSETVSIPLWCDCDLKLCGRRLWLNMFQSHYGAIATKFFLYVQSNISSVSIPLWCDCD